MIAFLEGVLVEKTQDAVSLAVAGVGFRIGMSRTSLSFMPGLGEKVRVFTHLQVREDALTLYGFAEPEEKELFLQLLGVSGVGPKVALAALSTYKVTALKAAIASQDIAAVSRVPGVGKKTASRIVLELKDSFSLPADLSLQQKAVALSSLGQQVTDALLAMGFTQTEASLALQDAPDGADEGTLLQYALKRLGGAS